MASKVGVYVCSGCGIGAAIDTEALLKIAKNEGKAKVCQCDSFLCGAEGIQKIKTEIAAEGLDCVVIAGCSSRTNTELFEFGHDVLVERVNIREQVAWTHEVKDEDTQAMAEDAIRMTMAKTKSLAIPEAYIPEEFSKTILVVGSGLAGMTAALEAAKAGYQVVLLEKEDSLGGWLNQVYQIPPLKAPFHQPQDPKLEEKISEITVQPNIKVYKSAIIEKTVGAPGMFEVTINQAGNKIVEKAGAIILASGSVPYDPINLKHLGYGQNANVITRTTLEKLAKKGNGEIRRPSDNKEVKNVVFLQCAGSRDPEHLPYCSAECCVESMKQALYFKKQNPEISVYIVYKDIRAIGQYELFYKEAQEKGVIFIKGDLLNISSNAQESVSIELENHSLGRKTILSDIDIMVLANGMVATTAFDNEGKLTLFNRDEALQPGNIIQSNILNLEYRQGPELPNLKFGFPDSNFICFPYESRRTGIYPAGSVKRPMNLADAMVDGMGAALKAIQCVEMTAKGEAMHPRSQDLSYPEFQLSRCTQCKRCTEECPFGAINEDEKNNPMINLTRCRRCGICMGACPERIISFKNYSVSMISNMVKSIEVPEEDEEKPRILVFACENDAIPALDMAGFHRLKFNAWIRIIPLRCLGSLNLIWINDAMSRGIDGVILLGCKHGEDYQCHFIKGSELAETRLSKVSETLDRLGLESERVMSASVSIMDYEEIPQLFNNFLSKLEDLGPNPMKGF